MYKHKIKIFLRRYIIMLCSLLLIITPKILFANSIETENYTIEIFPTTPTTSDIVFLKLEIRFCTPGFSVNRIFIDHIQRTINISLGIGSDISFTGCLPPIKSQIHIGKLVDIGVYKLLIYNENPKDVFDMENLIWDLDLIITESKAIVFHEVPSFGSTQSGIGIIRGWACDANIIEISIDNGKYIPVAYGTEREDTRTICGDSNNGYGMIFPWGVLGVGTHVLQTFVDGNEISNVEFEVAGFDDDFVVGLSGSYTLQDFPVVSESVTINWDEAAQNFIIINHNK